MTKHGPPDVLKVEERPDPAPPAHDEVTLEVAAAGVAFSEVAARVGAYPPAPKPPAVLGTDIAGTIIDTGPGVSKLSVGDRVFGVSRYGGHAERVNTLADNLRPLPEGLSFEQGAAVGINYATAWMSLVNYGGVQHQERARVLVHAAAGGVGHLAVQFAKHLGAHVIGTASKEKHDWLLSLGADEVIDYHSTAVEDATGDLDLVVDLIGGETTLAQSVKVLKPGGLLVAVPGGTSPELLAAAEAAGVRAKPFLVEPDGHALGEIAALVEAGEVRIEVEQVFPLAEAAAAHRRLATGRTRGKLVLDTVN
jgi:NADPH:quinone reductase-like Zn-dependent oxidoreductase